MPLPLLPGRACGECDVCCVALTIDDPALRKPQGVRCPNLAPNQGCSIYDTRPLTCRTFHCGWRHLKWIREGLRPDRSQVLVRLRQRPVDDAAPTTAVVFTILAEVGLEAEGLAESLAAAVAAGVPLFLEVPGPPGYTAGIGQINSMLEAPVRNRDKAGLLALLRWGWEQGRTGDHRLIDLG